MPACARRALVILFTCFAGVAVVAPSTLAEPRATEARPHTYTGAPVTRTSVHLAPRHRTIRFGHRVRFTTRVTGKLGPVGGQRVTVWSQRHGHRWHRAAAVKTNRDG